MAVKSKYNAIAASQKSTAQTPKTTSLVTQEVRAENGVTKDRTSNDPGLTPNKKTVF